jgi:hypothetical protein
MSTHAAETSVGASVAVAAPIERAFSVFTKRLRALQPAGAQRARSRDRRDGVEPRIGGHLYDRGVDGSECRLSLGEPQPPRLGASHGRPSQRRRRGADERRRALPAASTCTFGAHFSGGRPDMHWA